jgi:hypothetical protein
MNMHWTTYLQHDGADEKVPLAGFPRRAGRKRRHLMVDVITDGVEVR